ncbi:cupin-like domain-containing protein [Wenzhouxiangella sp. XN24]|uniref:cupin-like domain-containing protein n=1 Tax=Wenzhouxiangella sp. XN24 TaxID=2713569 RepID=UPI0013EB8C26|nr:cupin-like domain-containing protein [Wenzhouxiangella sp. XN24]NGX16335.1 transcriptional regulator [Wenzhouxiangella sp. XN24]
MSELKLASVDRLPVLDSASFQADYFRPLKPLVLQSLSKSWPASSKWTPEFFREVHGDKQVKVYDASFVAAGRNYMSGVQTLALRDYIDLVMTTEQDLRMFLYNIRYEIPELLEDIRVPDLVESVSKNFVFMFFGCKGSVTQMHFDIDMSHVLHTVIHGRRTVYLFPYAQGRNLHRYPFTCRSYVDVARPDFDQFPGLENAEGFKVTLEAGDTLYMPSGYWHHFVYDEAGYAVTFRCSSTTLAGKLHGFYNLAVMQMIDRLMNKLSPNSWFEWKRRRAATLQ